MNAEILRIYKQAEQAYTIYAQAIDRYKENHLVQEGLPEFCTNLPEFKDLPPFHKNAWQQVVISLGNPTNEKE